jgi:hypothetical protein
MSGSAGEAYIHPTLSVKPSSLQQAICHLTRTEGKQRSSGVVGPHLAPQDKFSLHCCQIGSEVKRNVGRTPLHQQSTLVQELGYEWVVSRITCARAQPSQRRRKVSYLAWPLVL